ncbi:hypothetical protein FQN49_006940, partial [Arthroderma sp. PD_2]
MVQCASRHPHTPTACRDRICLHHLQEAARCSQPPGDIFGKCRFEQAWVRSGESDTRPYIVLQLSVCDTVVLCHL